MYCPNCNRKLSDNVKYCPRCGTELPDSTNQIDPIVICGGIIRFGKRKTLPTGAWIFKCVAKDNDPINNTDPLYQRNNNGTIIGVLNPECLALCIGNSFNATLSWYHNMTRYLKKNINVGDSFLIEGGSEDSVIIMDGMKFEISRPPTNP